MTLDQTAAQLEKIDLELREMERRKQALLAERERLRQVVSAAAASMHPAKRMPPTTFKCRLCPKCFATMEGMQNHAQAKHGHGSEPRPQAAKHERRPDVLRRARNAAPIEWPPASTKADYRPDAHAGRRDSTEQMVRSTVRPELTLTEDASVNPLIRARLARKLSPGEFARRLGADVEVLLAVEKGRRKTLPREWRTGLAGLGLDFKALEDLHRTWHKETEDGAPIRRVGEARAEGAPLPTVHGRTEPSRRERATYNGEFRESSGRFGSYPLHDDYGEDAWPH